MERQKVCKRCLELKLITHFYRHDSVGNGRQGLCKECTKKRIQEARLDPVLGEKIRRYDRKRAKTKKRKKLAVESRRQWRNRERRKSLAERRYRNARTNKKLMPLPCWVCGSLQKIHGHHYDYDKPLEVLWLCSDHHVDMHRQIREHKIEL